MLIRPIYEHCRRGKNLGDDGKADRLDLAPFIVGRST